MRPHLASNTRPTRSTPILNIMGQYRPEYEVGQIAGYGLPAKYAEIDRRPAGEELEWAHAAARQAGLWRFDERWAV
ncbi:MAG: hypothetical protein ACLQIB_39400 [Isosphaeraceae bacterium]